MNIVRNNTLFFLFFMIDIAFAAGSAIDPNQVYQLDDIIRVGIALVVLISGFLSVIFILWGGMMLILSGGKDEKVKPAINSIRYAVVGLIVIILSIFVAPKVGDLLGLNVSTYVSPKVIFSTIQDLSGKFFGNKNEIDLSSGSNGGGTLPSDFSNL
ncbi:TPA: hypothetical protein DCZ36_02335 [Candidatus Gracilibacteria bacterium]|nr:hypothetical protein [Candidatus Gracilibacteria bacterium]